ncbi:hypothetical protein B5M44_19315 [Shinella sumterensis]|uniref:hypothetical protein n=1 Tax=Shinella sumterensis TaxID=1967501 RepID=UPI00106E85CC|nr:hypothetical protein [Shinella sumterensis]MCD1266097.1 hypothetical protein [Shinella sumterensis]TFE96587.1 hypothetical protein B5M44_19315 [Shinella sumterensis]
MSISTERLQGEQETVSLIPRAIMPAQVLFDVCLFSSGMRLLLRRAASLVLHVFTFRPSGK